MTPENFPHRRRFVHTAILVQLPGMSDKSHPSPGGDFAIKVVPARSNSEDVQMIDATLSNGNLNLIPYYVWSNRGVGRMPGGSNRNESFCIDFKIFKFQIDIGFVDEHRWFSEFEISSNLKSEISTC